MSAAQPLQDTSRRLILGSKSIEGFWLSDWVKTKSPLRMLRLLRKVGGLIRDGLLRTEIAATYSLYQIMDAVSAVVTPGRLGKVLLKMG